FPPVSGLILCLAKGRQTPLRRAASSRPSSWSTSPDDHPISWCYAAVKAYAPNSASAVTPPVHHLGQGFVTGRATGSLPRIAIRVERSAEVRARDEVAMRTGKGMLDQRLRTLGLSDARIKLAKFGLREGGHRRLRRLQAVTSARISRSVNPAS